MNTEVMQMYKDHGVSPLGGCLPMVLQMPVLFAFYAAISVSISSRQAPLALWIQDLSKMDPYYVLPLLMGAAMYGQQRMSPGVGDPVQQRIFRLMPIMFTFFFLTFPSGLVIYWLVNTVLGIAQQSYVNHQLGAPDATATKSPQKNKTSKGQKGGGARRKKRGKR
jgi:YidC/Oxa1 family membrane protein insertase